MAPIVLGASTIRLVGVATGERGVELIQERTAGRTRIEEL